MLKTMAGRAISKAQPVAGLRWCWPMCVSHMRSICSLCGPVCGPVSAVCIAKWGPSCRTLSQWLCSMHLCRQEGQFARPTMSSPGCPSCGPSSRPIVTQLNASANGMKDALLRNGWRDQSAKRSWIYCYGQMTCARSCWTMCPAVAMTRLASWRRRGQTKSFS